MIYFPPYAEPLFKPYRYKVLAGGRGSAKSYSVARALLLKGMNQTCRILCGREFQNSMADSVHKLLSDQIEEMGLQSFYSVTQQSITGENGTEFIFKGVRHNVNSIKSMVGITDLWLEEAHTISKISWDVLVPTIRENNSEIWVTFNPESDDDPTYTKFFDKEGTPLDIPNSLIMKVNWDKNPWFPEVLRTEKDHLYKVNPDLADHVWGGNIRKNSDSQIFKGKWKVEEFTANESWEGPYFGADFGFSKDPSTLTKVYLDFANRRIMIEYAIFGYHIELDYLADLYDKVPGSRDYKIRADCARPETISHVKSKGFNIEAAEKWAGSVEDGVEWLRNWNEIIIHPRCTEMITEAKNYSYKVDRLTQDVLTDIVDAYNHGWDAIRYGFQPMIMKNGNSILDLY